MASLYIFIILLFRVVQAVFSKSTSNKIKNSTMLLGYQSLQNLISAVLGLILILISFNGLVIDTLTVIFALFAGLSIFFSSVCGIYAMKSGTVALNSMFGTAGMIIPILAGAVFWGNSVSVMQMLGLLLFFFAAYLLIGVSKTVYANFNRKTFFLLLGAMFSNGFTMLSQQLFTKYVPQGDVNVFSFLSFGIIALMSGIFYRIMPKAKNITVENTKIPKSLIICAVALAVSVFVINQLATLSTSLLPPVILFTFINGGGTIISTLVAAILYKEKLTLKTSLGVTIGILSLIIIKMF